MSDAWAIEVLEDDNWVRVERTSDWMSPSLGYRPVRNAWLLDARWRVGLPPTRITHPDGATTVLPHLTRSET